MVACSFIGSLIVLVCLIVTARCRVIHIASHTKNSTLSHNTIKANVTVKRQGIVELLPVRSYQIDSGSHSVTHNAYAVHNDPEPTESIDAHVVLGHSEKEHDHDVHHHDDHHHDDHQHEHHDNHHDDHHHDDHHEDHHDDHHDEHHDDHHDEHHDNDHHDEHHDNDHHDDHHNEHHDNGYQEHQNNENHDDHHDDHHDYNHHDDQHFVQHYDDHHDNHHDGDHHEDHHNYEHHYYDHDNDEDRHHYDDNFRHYHHHHHRHRHYYNDENHDDDSDNDDDDDDDGGDGDFHHRGHHRHYHYERFRPFLHYGEHYVDDSTYHPPLAPLYGIKVLDHNHAEQLENHESHVPQSITIALPKHYRENTEEHAHVEYDRNDNLANKLVMQLTTALDRFQAKEDAQVLSQSLSNNIANTLLLATKQHENPEHITLHDIIHVVENLRGTSHHDSQDSFLHPLSRESTVEGRHGFTIHQIKEAFSSILGDIGHNTPPEHNMISQTIHHYYHDRNQHDNDNDHHSHRDHDVLDNYNSNDNHHGVQEKIIVIKQSSPMHHPNRDHDSDDNHDNDHNDDHDNDHDYHRHNSHDNYHYHNNKDDVDDDHRHDLLHLTNELQYVLAAAKLRNDVGGDEYKRKLEMEDDFAKRSPNSTTENNNVTSKDKIVMTVNGKVPLETIGNNLINTVYDYDKKAKTDVADVVTTDIIRPASSEHTDGKKSATSSEHTDGEKPATSRSSIWQKKKHNKNFRNFVLK